MDRLFIGSSDFDSIIASGAFFVDKTLFIKDFVESHAIVNIILGPRRFGKSMNLNMLGSFLSGSSSSKRDIVQNYFRNSRVGRCQHLLDRHFGQHDVIYLSLKDCVADTWQEMLETLWICIIDMFKPHLAELSDAKELESINFYSYNMQPNIWMMCSMKLLLNLVASRTCKQAVLVDEYDTPLNCAFRNGFYDQASKFFGTFFSMALKDNKSL